MNAKDKFGFLDEKIEAKMISAGRDGRGMMPPSPLGKSGKNKAGGFDMGVTPEFDVMCPHCQAKGDFLQEVNKVLQNCIDFCEFPHACRKTDGQREIIWATLSELQTHACFYCPKFGCDICYRDEF